MKTKRTPTITSMLTPDTIIRVIRLDGDSYSREEAARILDIDVDTLRARGVRMEKIDGHARPRIPRAELLRLLAAEGIKMPAQPVEEIPLEALPARTRRTIAVLQTEAGLLIR